MAIIAPVQDGKVVETESTKKDEKVTGSSSALDKDAFLQLLVAQMKYQDPLEPTSNTEYISQFATFSELEQMQNLAATSELNRASNLVGKIVYVRKTASDGTVGYEMGKVDYVYYENNKAYLSIKGALYPLDDLDTICDPEYSAAFDKAYDLAIKLNKLPSLANLSLGDQEQVEEIYKIYNEMTDYEKTFVAKDYVDKINAYYEKLQELLEAAGGSTDPGEEDGEGGEESGGTEGEGGETTE